MFGNLNLKKPNKLFFLLVGIISFSSLICLVSAHDPYSHIEMNKIICQDPRVSQSLYLQIACNNMAYFNAGDVGTDITVPKYITNYLFHIGGEYPATHNWAFQDCLMREASKNPDPKYEALALGNAAHQLQDAPLHNTLIPKQIIQQEVPNIPAHPVWEASELGVTYKNDPQIAIDAQTVMAPLINDPYALKMWETCIGEQAALRGFNTKDSLNFLNGALASPDGWFTKVFALPGVYKQLAFGDTISGILAIMIAVVVGYLLMWRMRHWRIRAVIFIGFFLIGGLFMLNGGLYGIADKSQVALYQQTSEELTIQMFQPQNWNCGSVNGVVTGKCQYDATGYANLQFADSQVWNIYYLLMFTIIIVVAFFSYRWFKTRGKKRK